MEEKTIVNLGGKRNGTEVQDQGNNKYLFLFRKKGDKINNKWLDSVGLAA
jgi:hypothetical protein